MSEDEHRQASLSLRDLTKVFALPADWPVTIRKQEGQTMIGAGELVRRIEKRYGLQRKEP